MLHMPLATWARCKCAASSIAGRHQLRHFRFAVVAMAKPWRPDMNDVDRLSKGDGAKRRGTGNFNIPHRLNSDERPVYEAAKKKGYLQVRGTGYRKGAGGRKGNPLPNVYRQWCDAKASACIVIEQDMTGTSSDVVVVDLAPLRVNDLAAAVELCGRLAAAAGARQVTLQERPLDAAPFNVLPVELPTPPQQLLCPESGQAAAAAAPTPEQLASAEMAVLQQADLVRQLKANGLGNSSPEVQQHVQELLKLKADLQQLAEAAAHQDGSSNGSSSSFTAEALHGIHSGSSPETEADDDAVSNSTSSSSRRQQTLDEDHPFATSAIWQLPVLPLFFEADRTSAKGLAKTLHTQLAAAGLAATR